MNKLKLHDRVNRGVSTAIILTLGTVLASAHPGHSLQHESIAHTLTSPYHLLTLALIGGGLLLVARFVRRVVPRRALQFTGGLALIVAAVTATSPFHG